MVIRSVRNVLLCNPDICNDDNDAIILKEKKHQYQSYQFVECVIQKFVSIELVDRKYKGNGNDDAVNWKTLPVMCGHTHILQLQSL